MLDPDDVDLADLAFALEDHSPEHTWWVDPASGEVKADFLRRMTVRGHVPGAGLVPVQPLPTTVGYGDMEDFAGQVRDSHVRTLLEQALAGRGAFRRFKDALLDYPALRRSWFAFHDARWELRALEWLADEDLADPGAVAEAVAARAEPAAEPLSGVLDAEGVARRAARDLRRLYRERLRRVVLVGSWARGDAHPDAELELLVVLDAVEDRWKEKARMDRVMWRHSIRNDTVLTETPVASADYEDAATPRLARARSEGVRVA